MTPRIFLAALLTILVWGASPVATKFAVLGFPPLSMAVGRTLIGALAVLPLLLATRARLPESFAHKRLLIVSALGSVVLFPVIFTFGMSATSGVHGAMILAFLPVTTGAIAHAWDRRVPDKLWWLGCALALAGEFVLTFSRDVAGQTTATLTGDLLIWASLSFASMGYVAGARLTRTGYPAKFVTYWGVAIMGLLMLPFAPLLFGHLDYAAIPASAWVAMIYMGLIVTVLGYICWYYALAKGGIEQVGLFQFFQPVVGVFTAALLLGETLSPWLLIAASLILGGVYVATRAPRHIPAKATRSK